MSEGIRHSAFCNLLPSNKESPDLRRMATPVNVSRVGSFARPTPYARRYCLHLSPHTPFVLPPSPPMSHAPHPRPSFSPPPLFPCPTPLTHALRPSPLLPPCFLEGVQAAALAGSSRDFIRKESTSEGSPQATHARVVFPAVPSHGLTHPARASPSAGDITHTRTHANGH